MKTHNNKPDFIGIGAQRSGTSWMYANLYEHPDICAPEKEIHFFSRERNWFKGYEWYESHFRTCSLNKKKGEYSTSYLYDSGSASRIHARYPDVKIIACLRNPIDRAFSNYLNDMPAGNIDPTMTFEEALEIHPEYVAQGYYTQQIKRYYDLFPQKNILVLIYEDHKKNPLEFIQSIYHHIGVDETFVPTMLTQKVGEGRRPRLIIIEKIIIHSSHLLRSFGLRKLWWLLKKSGIARYVSRLNTHTSIDKKPSLTQEQRQKLYALFKDDIHTLEKMLKRKLNAWKPQQ